VISRSEMHNNFVKATPVFAVLFCLGQVPGAPYGNR
jgi:hypothetical protein